MSAFQIVLALHLDKPRGRAPESIRAVAGCVKLFGGRGGRADEMHVFVVERVDQKNEAARLVAHLRTHLRDMVDEHGREIARDLEIVGGTQRLRTEVRE